MRIIAGVCKGRPLKAVKGMSTRPTTDKVKKSIFNMVGPYFEGGFGLDLFAGSGGLGLEGLSRGLHKVIFIDKDAKAIDTIYENVKKCDFQDLVEVYRNDASRALKSIIKRGLQFSVIFLDPPYKKQNIIELLTQIDENQLLLENGVIVTEHDTEIELPSEIGSLKRSRKESYGITTISIYSKY